MVQFFNAPAVSTLLTCVWKQPALLIPRISCRSVADIDFQALYREGVRAIAFDKDNTLTAPYAAEVHPTLLDAMADCRRVFGPDRVAIFSNSAGSSDDATFADARRLSSSLGIAVIEHGTKKPAGADALFAHLGHSGGDVAFVGDRVLTDIVFGNLHGMRTVLVEPFTGEGDHPTARALRPLERLLLRLVQSAHA